MKTTKRALRRHHYNRLKAKRVRDHYWYRGWCATQWDDQRLGQCINTPAICSCQMCRNPRRCDWNDGKNKLTIQERRVLPNKQEGIEEC